MDTSSPLLRCQEPPSAPPATRASLPRRRSAAPVRTPAAPATSSTLKASLKRLPGRLHIISLLIVSPCLSACNVTIHNRCRDALASCSKMKQRVRHRNTHMQNYTPQEITHAVSHTPGLHRYSVTVVVAAMHAPFDAGLDLCVYSSCPPACLAAPAEMGAAVWSISSQTRMVTLLKLMCQKETPVCLPVSRQVPPAQHHQVRLL